MPSSAKVVTFGGFKRRVAGMARLKPFCVTGAILLHRCQKMSCIFRSRRSTLETSIVILRGRRRDVSRQRVACVFFWRIALSGLRQVVTMCKSRGKRGASRECHFAWQGQYFGHSTLFTLHTLYAPHFTVDTLHSTHPGSNLGKGVAPGFLPTFDSKIRQHFVR